MKKLSFTTACIVLFGFFILSCQSGPEVIHDLSDASYQLLNQDSSGVSFPQDFKGNVVVVGFIYTHCPDICPIISAKMSNINNQLEDNSDVHFAEISFDPGRDTPSVLKKYMQSFRLDSTKFTMLTGDSLSIDSALIAMDVFAKIAYTKNKEDGEREYLMNHTNRILIMDKQGRVRFEYPGSAASEKIIIEDINKLR